MTSFKLDTHRIDNLLGSLKESPHKGTVEDEYKKHVSATLSPHGMDILHFWEVSYFSYFTVKNEHRLGCYSLIGVSF